MKKENLNLIKNSDIICFIIDNMETLMNLYDWINFVIFAFQN